MLRFLLGFALLFTFSFVRADEYDDLRLKLRGMLIGTGYDTADPTVASRLLSIASTANSHWSTMDKSPTRTFLWSDLASTTNSGHITDSFTRLRSMAYGYVTPGCSLQGNATLLADIIGGLDWMFANRYGATTAQYFNWWDWEIGSPLRLTDTCVLLYDQLTSTQLTNYMNAVNYQVPTPDMTQANKIWKARAVGMRGCLVKDSAKLVLARDAFSAVFPYVTSGDGYYTDGSFIQHDDIPSTASYGAVLIATMAPTLAWLNGSTWAVTDPAQSNLFRWVFDSYEPIIYNGNIFDHVRGRDIGNAGVGPSADGMLDSILQIAQVAPPADAARMKSMIKEWALADYTRDFVSNRGLPTLTLAKQMMNDPAVVRRGELIKHYTFAEMDRVVHLGAGYGLGLSMCSTRIANFESINGENLRGWFTGDGQTILYNGDLTAFGDSYWATVDHYRLPGTTADVTHSKPPTSNTTGPRALGQSTLSPHSWVGGATLGAYGAAGMQFKGVGVTLTGKKSWFMFDDEIVCLGQGITSTDSRPIETTIEQRKINTAGTNAFTVNGTAKSTTLGWTETMSATSWAHLTGNAAGSDIGYYFPVSTTVKAVREARTGAWSDIEDVGSTAPITRNYLRMTFEHGSNPTNATYQYVLLPGRNAIRTGHYAAAPQVTVLANNANVQAVTETTLGITAANFWTDTSQTIGGITSNKKASVLVRDDGTFIDVSVSDPTQLNTGTIALQISLNGGTLVSADSGVTVTQSTPSIIMSVSTANAAGKTFKARFYKLTPQVVNLSPVADTYAYDGAAFLDTSYGTENKLVIKKAGSGSNRESYLRFDVPATSNGLLLGASLNLTCTTTTTPGVNAVAKVDDNAWGETTLTWNNKPAAGAILDSWTPALSTTSRANVTSAVPASGFVSFKVYATTETTNGIVYYGSKENTTAANIPQLSLTYGHMPPEVSMTAPDDGTYIAKAGTVTLTANAIATDGAIASVAFYDGAILLGTDTSAPYSITPMLAGGPHFLRAVATGASSLSRTSLINRVDVAYPPVANSSTRTTPKNTAADVDLSTLVSDIETPLSSLKFQLGLATNGTVALLADGRTARFTPAAGYTGPASFIYTVTNTTRDERTVLNYTFQNSDYTDGSGQGRNAMITVQGTGAATFATSSPLPDYTRCLTLTENGTVGAARLDRANSELDLAAADWTLAGWFRRTAATNMDVIAHLGNSPGFGNAGSSSLSFGFFSNGTTLQLRHWNSSNVEDITINRTSVSTAAWHHFAIVRSGATISLYVDGTLAGSDSSFSLNFDTTVPIKWGGANSTSVPDRWLNGSLADLAIFNAPLSPAEITKLTTTPVQWFGGQNASATVTITVLTPVGTWWQQNLGTTSNTGLNADTADKDNDGTPNLLEYAFATDPNTSNPSTYSATQSGSTLDFVYTKNKAATDVTYALEWSDTLANDWSTVGVAAPVILSDNGTTQQIKVTVPYGAGAGRRFVRLKVTRP